MSKKIKNFIYSNFFRPRWYSILFNPYFIARLGLYKKIKKYANKDFGGKSILDVGCGIKPYTFLFKNNKEYIGIDIKSGGHFEKEKEPDLYFDGINIPFESQRFDLVICTQVLEHAEYPEKLLNEINRVLKNTGEIFITIPFVWNEHEIPYDFRRLTRYGLDRLLISSGFKIQELEETSGFFGTIGQLISAFIFETIGRNLILKSIFAFILCFPIQFSFLVLNTIFRSHWLTLDYVVVAKKHESN